jgi:hypothetical protein
VPRRSEARKGRAAGAKGGRGDVHEGPISANARFGNGDGVLISRNGRGGNVVRPLVRRNGPSGNDEAELVYSKRYRGNTRGGLISAIEPSEPDGQPLVSANAGKVRELGRRSSALARVVNGLGTLISDNARHANGSGGPIRDDARPGDHSAGPVRPGARPGNGDGRAAHDGGPYGGDMLRIRSRTVPSRGHPLGWGEREGGQVAGVRPPGTSGVGRGRGVWAAAKAPARPPSPPVKTLGDWLPGRLGFSGVARA